MLLLLYTLIISLFTADYLALGLKVAPRAITWLPDLLSGLLLLGVVLRATRLRNLRLGPKYLVLAIFFTLFIAVGVLINAEPSGAVFAGLRTYLRYLPLFLLPAVYEISERDMRRLLSLFLVLCLLQAPVAFYQRFVEYRALPTGDVIVGTLMVSSDLTIVLYGAMTMLFAFYLKGEVSKPVLFISMPLLFFPTAINETAVSIFLLPMAVFLPVLLLRDGNRMRRLVPMALIGIMLGGAFFSVYNAFYASRWGNGGLESLITSGEILQYSYRGATKDSRTGHGKEMSEIGRVDSIILPFKVQPDPVLLFSGLGIGNVSDSFSERFTGEYYQKYGPLGAGMTTASIMIWEIGLIGLGLSVIFLAFVFVDGRALGTLPGLPGAIGIGWAVVAMMMGLLLVYKNLIAPGVIGYPMWLLSGYVAAERQVRVPRRASRRASPYAMRTTEVLR